LEQIDKQTVNFQENDEISLKEVILRIKDWWKYLFSKWIIILLAGLLGGGIGFIYAFIQKPTYVAELSFALEDDKAGGGLGGALGIASQFGFDLGGSGGGGAFAGDNLVELIKSRSIIEKTLLSTLNINGKNQTLVNYYIEFSKLENSKSDLKEEGNIQFLPNSDRSKFTRQQDSLLGVFHKAFINGILSVEKKDKKLSIITVKMKSSNELFSKLFTERLVKEVSDFYIETKTKKSAENLAILQHQTDSVRNALNSAISGVATSFDANPNPNQALQILRVPSQRRTVDVQANQAILTELVKNLEISKVSLRKETPLIQIIDRPILPLAIEKSSKKTSLILGGFLFGFLTVSFLIFKRLLQNL
jgi:uncharacterized protein involved in exopolysaccharide biosynthesis